MCALVLRSVIIAVLAVGGCVGDGGLGVEVDELDVEARRLRGGGEVEAVEDAGFGAREVGAGGCNDGEGGRSGAEEVAGEGEANPPGCWGHEGPGHGCAVGWCLLASEAGIGRGSWECSSC